MQPFEPCHRRDFRAFTTLELLVVISIIILLGGILIVSISAVLRTTQEHATKAQLENAVGILTEFEQTTKLSIQSKPTQWYFQNSPVDAQDTPTVWPLVDFWHIPYVIGTPPSAVVPSPLPPAALVKSGELGRDARYAPQAGEIITNDAVANTVVAFQKFQTVSKVREIIGKMPADKVYVVQNSFIQTALNLNPLPPILLDAWNNPMIYVPSSGIQVYLHKGKPDQQLVTVTSADKRPFFASAGKDGDFSTGDDNLYSFEK